MKYYSIVFVTALLLIVGVFFAAKAEGPGIISLVPASPSPILLSSANPVPCIPTYQPVSIADTKEGVGRVVWMFLNSSVGLAVVAFFLSSVLGKLFLWKPRWSRYVEKYRPLIVAGIRKAEKEIPDDVPNAGLQRLDVAMQYILSVHDTVYGETTGNTKRRIRDKHALAQAITVIHAEMDNVLTAKKDMKNGPGHAS